MCITVLVRLEGCKLIIGDDLERLQCVHSSFDLYSGDRNFFGWRCIRKRETQKR